MALVAAAFHTEVKPSARPQSMGTYSRPEGRSDVDEAQL